VKSADNLRIFQVKINVILFIFWEVLVKCQGIFFHLYF